jgi:hypothetical protein
MGHKFKAGKSVKQPEGSYEDAAIWKATVDITSPLYEMDKKAGLSVDSWLNVFSIQHKNCIKPLKGAKCVHFAWLTVEQLQEIKPRLVVRTHRNKKDVVDSYNRWGARSGFNWSRYYDKREESMDQLEHDSAIKFVHLYFLAKPARVSTVDIITQVRPHISWLQIDHGQ